MSKRKILSAAVVAGMVTDASFAAQTSSDADDLIPAPSEPSDLLGRPADSADITIAELMYAGDGNVGFETSPGRATTRAPKPKVISAPTKSSDVRGTVKARPNTEKGPRLQPRTSKKGD